MLRYKRFDARLYVVRSLARRIREGRRATKGSRINDLRKSSLIRILTLLGLFFSDDAFNCIALAISVGLCVYAFNFIALAQFYLRPYISSVLYGDPGECVCAHTIARLQHIHR